MIRPHPPAPPSDLRTLRLWPVGRRRRFFVRRYFFRLVCLIVLCPFVDWFCIWLLSRGSSGEEALCMRGRSVKSWNRTRIDGGSAVSDPYPGADSRPHAQCSCSNAADGSCSLPPPPPPHILYSIPTFNPGSAFALEAAAAAAGPTFVGRSRGRRRRRRRCW